MPNNMLLLSDRDDAREEKTVSTSRLRAAMRLVKVVLRVKRRAGERPSLAHPAASLSPDVLISFFELLGFNDRLRASHVCRYWRRVALGTPLLWSTFEIGTPGQEGLDKLDAMVRRTQSVALSVTLLLPVNEEIGTALDPHFGRLRALRCQDAPQRLTVPLLESLVIERFQSDLVALSEDYVCKACACCSCASRLVRCLRVSASSEPGSRPRRLSAACSTCALRWWCDINLAVDPAPLFGVALPLGLADVTINGLLLWSDHSYHTLRHWHGHRFRRLALSRAQDVTAALYLFGAALDAEPWSMQMLVEDNGALRAHNGVVTLRTHSDTARARVVVPAFPRIAAVEAIWGIHDCAQIARLTELRLAPLFFDVLVEDGVALPGLTALALVSDEARGDALPGRVHPVPGIHAPLLRSFAFACLPGQTLRRGAVQWFFGELPRYLREWMVYDAELLETVALEGIITKEALKKVGRRRSAIYSLAREVRLDASAVA